MNWLISNFELVWGLTLEHVRLSAIPIVLGFLISIPLGFLASRYRAAKTILLPLAGALFTIPSLALFVVIPLILGTQILDQVNVIVALVIYAVAVMLRGASDAFSSVSVDVKQSAKAVGYASFSRFWTVDFPLAGPVLLANLRVVSVTTVSLLSVAALIGRGGLGRLFTEGYQRDFPEEVAIGIIASLLIALVFDLILVLLGRALMPWSHVAKSSRRRGARGDGAARTASTEKADAL